MKRLFVIIALLCMCVIPAYAADYTGTLNPVLPAAQIIEPLRVGAANFVYDGSPLIITWRMDFDTIGIPDSYIMYSAVDCFAVGSSTFTIKDNAGIIATGTINFLNGTAMYGTAKQYMYLKFASWTPAGRTGVSGSGMNLSIPSTAGITVTDPTGLNIFGLFDIQSTSVSMPLGGESGGGTITNGADGAIYTPYPYTTKYDYTVDGLGGTGVSRLSTLTFTKPSNNLATNARAYNATTGNLLWQSAFTDATTGEAPIITGSNYFLSMYVPLNGFIYNSSAFYPPTTPTPTPTGGIPAGYVRTYAQNVDGKSGGSIHYSNLQLNDVENSSWTNYTSDFDATGYIDTLPGHTLNFYGDATGYVATSRLGLSPFDGIYELIMWSTTAFPSAGLSNINLIVIVNDVRTATPLYNANVIVTVPSGTTTGAKTNNAGSVTFVVPNKSVVHVTADYSGYISGTEVITTSDWGPDTLRIEIGKATVTPTITATPLPGELTARPTIDTRTGAQKDSAMMDMIRNNGEGLVGLAIIATVLGLFGLMKKSM